MSPSNPARDERVLDAAAASFGRFGYRKVAIEEIARAAGVGKGSVYLVAKSKADLLYRVVHREVRAWVAEVAEGIDPRRPAPELLLGMALVGESFMERRPLVRQLLEGSLDQVLPLWTSRLDDLRRIGRRNTIEVLELGVEQGHFRDDLDLPGVARLLSDLHAMSWMLSTRSDEPTEARLARLQLAFDLLLNGLRRR